MYAIRSGAYDKYTYIKKIGLKRTQEKIEIKYKSKKKEKNREISYK